MRERWYIDGWSVIDGYAFASLRDPGSLDALATFFVSPPYFEPEPVASLATALAATRGHFQEGYRARGEEVAFGSPEQVVETVRRAYRAGGLNLDGTPLPSAPGPRPALPGEVSPESLVDGRIDGIWRELQPVLHRGYADDWPRQTLEAGLSDLIEAVFPALVAKFVGYTVVHMLEAIQRGPKDPNLAAQELGAWIARAWSFGIHVDLRSGVGVAARGSDHEFGWQVPELAKLPPALIEWLSPLGYRSSGAAVSDLRVPFAVPIPYKFQSSAEPHTVPIPTLGHLIAAISADPWCLWQIDSVIKFVPVIVGALSQLPTSALPYQGLPVVGSRALGDIGGATARWLARTLPSAQLRGHVAEETIHSLVVRLLTGTNDTGPEPLLIRSP